MSSVFEQPWSGRHVLVAQRLRHRRDELGLTQKQVVTRLGRIGVLVSNRTLSSLEHGAGLDVGKLPELACVLECTVTYLLGLTTDPGRWSPDQHHELFSPRGDVSPRGENNSPGAGPVGVHPSRASCILGTDVPDRIRR